MRFKSTVLISKLCLKYRLLLSAGWNANSVHNTLIRNVQDVVMKTINTETVKFTDALLKMGTGTAVNVMKYSFV